MEGTAHFIQMDYDHHFREWEDDVRLMILMIVSSFIILSLIVIIFITTCVLLCSDDDMEESQSMEYLMQVSHLIRSAYSIVLSCTAY